MPCWGGPLALLHCIDAAFSSVLFFVGTTQTLTCTDTRAQAEGGTATEVGAGVGNSREGLVTLWGLELRETGESG